MNSIHCSSLQNSFIYSKKSYIPLCTEHKALVVSNDETIEEYGRMIANMDEKKPIIHQVMMIFKFEN